MNEILFALFLGIGMIALAYVAFKVVEYRESRKVDEEEYTGDITDGFRYTENEF